MSVWDETNTVRLLVILLGTDIPRAELHDGTNKRLFYETMIKVSNRMKSVNCSFTPCQITMKFNQLRKVYSEETIKMANDPSYSPPMIWYPLLKDIFNNVKQEENCNPNASECEISNQSCFENETDDDDEVDEPTQENNNIRFIREHSTPCKTAENVPNDLGLFSREDLICPSPQSSDVNNRHNDMSAARDEMVNKTNSTISRNDIAIGLDSFGQYLISLLKQLPWEVSFGLQKQFINETLNAAAIEIENERKRKKKVYEATNLGLMNDRLIYFTAPAPPLKRFKTSRLDEKTSNERRPHTDKTGNSSKTNHKDTQITQEKNHHRGHEKTVTVDENESVVIEIKEE